METVLFTEKELQNRVYEISQQINNIPTTQPPVLICVLNGAFMFFTDLVKNIDKCHIDFIQCKSYVDNKQYQLTITKNKDINIEGRDVYLIDDIYDSGVTMDTLYEKLQQENPKSLTVVTLFKRWDSPHQNYNNINGFLLQDESFLVGYGLDDEKGLSRNLPYIKGILNDCN